MDDSKQRKQLFFTMTNTLPMPGFVFVRMLYGGKHNEIKKESATKI